MAKGVTTNSLADHLDAWAPWATWAALAAGFLTLIIADRAFPAVGLGPLYIPLIALAGWRLGLLVSCLIAALAALLNIFPFHVREVGLDVSVMLARGIIRLSAYVFIIALVHALRGAYDRERARATHDGLTGAMNRAAFERDLEALLNDNGPRDEAIALALIDLDDFKRINDTHGHGAGDQVLRALTAAAMNAVGERGRLYRVGGDEFVVVMPLASIAAGQPVVEQLHNGLTAALGRSPYPTTLSMGALVFQPKPALDRTALMFEADRHMYASKASGKGVARVVALHPGCVAATTWSLRAA